MLLQCPEGCSIGSGRFDHQESTPAKMMENAGGGKGMSDLTGLPPQATPSSAALNSGQQWLR